MRRIDLANILRILVIVVGLATCSTGAQKVFFAGFAYAGDAGFIANNFPLTSGWDPEGAAINTALRSRLPSFHSASLELADKYQLADLSAGDALCLAVVLDQEVAVTEAFSTPSGTKYKNTVELGVEAMFFDFRKMGVVGSYPLIVQYRDVTPTAPSTRETTEVIKSLFAGTALGTNLCDELFGRLHGLAYVGRSSQTVQVSEVEIAPEAFGFAPPAFQANPHNFQIYLAQTFSRALSQRLGVSVLPYTKGQVGYKMALRFSDSNILQLEVPRPTYAIKLDLRKFKKVLYSESEGVGQAWIYGSFVGITMTEPQSGQTYLNEALKKGLTVKQIEGWSPTYEWYPYQESLALLFDEFVQALPSEKKYATAIAHLKNCQ